MSTRDRVRIGILEAGVTAPEVRAEHGTALDWFGGLLAQAAGDRVEVRGYVVCEGELPSAPGECDAYLITGSAASAYDDAPWIAATADFSLSAARDRPVVGICFGHQLLAHFAGGRVERSERGWGVGVHRYQVSARRSWMDPDRGGVAALASHQDQVVEVPPGTEVLAGSDFCPYGMLHIDENILTFQNHPEMGSDYARNLYTGRAERIGADRLGDALESLERPTDAAILARWIWCFVLARLVEDAVAA